MIVLRRSARPSAELKSVIYYVWWSVFPRSKGNFSLWHHFEERLDSPAHAHPPRGVFAIECSPSKRHWRNFVCINLLLWAFKEIPPRSTLGYSRDAAFLIMRRWGCDSVELKCSALKNNVKRHTRTGLSTSFVNTFMLYNTVRFIGLLTTEDIVATFVNRYVDSCHGRTFPRGEPHPMSELSHL